MPALNFEVFSEELLALYRPPLRARRTWQKMRQVLAGFGRSAEVKTTAELTLAAVARYVASRPPLESPETTNGVLGYLHAATSYAVAMGYVRVDPFTVRKRWIRRDPPRGPDPAHPRHHPRAANARVLELLGSESKSAGWEGGRLHALAALVAYTGVRRDEALCAMAADFDLEAGVFMVYPPRRLKTAASAAPVPMPDALVRVLAGWIPRCGSPWAFPGVKRQGPWTGGMHGRRPIDRLKQAGRRAGVEGFTFQSLRHSWATHAEHWGLGELAVQRVLRHTTTRTQRHYRHADLDNLREAVAPIDFREPRREAG